MKVAIVHDWLVTYAGAEKVLQELLFLFPDADIFSLVDFLPDEERHFIKERHIYTSSLQNLPCSRKKYRNYLPFMPYAIEQFDLSGYDLVVSSSHAVAKGVITGPNQVHISYVHTPIRYAWDLQHQYLREANLETGIKGLLARLVLHYIRQWDCRTANGVDHFIANSEFIAKRIYKVYRREATVIYPPVDVSTFSICKEKKNFYITASRMVPYKKIDLIVEAFSSMPDKQLIVIGNGPEMDKVRSKAGSNIQLLGYQPTVVLRDYMQQAKAFVFAAEEDFGITPVEAQACGTPVIAYGKGGALETIRGLDSEHPTGIFFHEQTIEAIIEAVQLFEINRCLFEPAVCRENSLRFSPERFRSEIKAFINEKLQ